MTETPSPTEELLAHKDALETVMRHCRVAGLIFVTGLTARFLDVSGMPLRLAVARKLTSYSDMRAFRRSVRELLGCPVEVVDLAEHSASREADLSSGRSIFFSSGWTSGTFEAWHRAARRRPGKGSCDPSLDLSQPRASHKSRSTSSPTPESRAATCRHSAVPACNAAGGFAPAVSRANHLLQERGWEMA